LKWVVGVSCEFRLLFWGITNWLIFGAVYVGLQ
jgi:hypothetical protein